MFKRIVFNQFRDLKKQGKDPMKARLGSMMLVGVLVLVLALDIFFIGVSYHIFDMPHKPNGMGGKFIGRLFGLAFIGVIFLLFYFGLGKKTIERYYEEYNQLDEEMQQQEAKKGLLYFLVPFISLMLIFFVIIFKSI